MNNLIIYVQESITHRSSICQRRRRSFELAELHVEGAEREMPGFAGYLQDQAIGEAKSRPTTIVLQRRGHDVAVLDRKALVIEQHFHGRGDRGVIELICGA